MLVAGGKVVLGSCEASAKWVKGLMVVEIAVGLRAKAAVHTCTVITTITVITLSRVVELVHAGVSPE